MMSNYCWLGQPEIALPKKLFVSLIIDQQLNTLMFDYLR